MGNRRLAFTMTAVVAGLLGANVLVARADGPEWIWRDADRSRGDDYVLLRSFRVDGATTSAVLRVGCESAIARVEVNGKRVLSLDPYDSIRELDATALIRRGKNSIGVWVTGVSGPSAFFAQLEIAHVDGSTKTVVTDERWLADDSRGRPAQPAISLGAVDSRLLVSKQQRIGISKLDNYEQWKQALNDPISVRGRFVITPGFELTMVRAAKEDEDSWVSMAFDGQGRILIGKEKVGLLRLTLDAEGDRVTKSETVETSLKECRGLLIVGDTLYANANNSKALFRLKARGDGFGPPESIYAPTGGVGHGRNDLALGPDGMIYAIQGDAVDAPKQAVRNSTSPYREARRGLTTREGRLVRIDPKSLEVETLTAGLRNPYGIDFNSLGDIFTYDADAEYDMGAPWYRPTRMQHLMRGGDYGWRGVTKSWPAYYPDHPDNAPSNFDVGKGSPTSVKSGARSHFPSRYRNAMFALDWAYGRILAVHALPRGASYVMTAETFLKGRPLNVTDLDFANDGSMYFVTGGRGTQSALYRVRYVGPKPKAPPAQTAQQLARLQFAGAARARRRQLEAMLNEQEIASISDSVWASLGDDDPWIRHAARNLLERCPLELWAERALTETNADRAVTALLALARDPEGSRREKILKRLNSFNWPQSTIRQSDAMLFAYQLCLKGEGPLPADLARETRLRIEGLPQTDERILNRRKCELLAKVGSEYAIAETLELLANEDDQHQQMHYTYVLRNAKGEWTRAQRLQMLRSLHSATSYLGGAGMPDFLARIREEWLAGWTPAERESLRDELERLSQGRAIESSSPLPKREFVHRWTASDYEALLTGFTNLRAKRDLKRGAQLFHAAACAKCHRFGARGGVVGPDLTSVGGRFGTRDLLQAIVEPSKVIAEKYQSVHVVTKQGRTYSGQPAPGGDYRSPVLRLQVDPLDSTKTVDIRKVDIELQKTSPVSWMPEGLLNTLSEDEILDLIAYLQSATR